MKVRALTSFVGTVDGQRVRASEGDELELPKGVDWLESGLVEPVGRSAETATTGPAEKAVAVKRSRTRKPRSK